jgi:flavodoxin
MPKLNTDNIDCSLFSTNINENTCYILGLLWADGSMCHNMVALECAEEDIHCLKEDFLSTGKWNIRFRKRSNWKPQMVYHISNKEFSNYLKENDYDKKSFISPDKILQKIPDNFKKFWFRGYWDGDGCFYYNIKNSATSTYNQDWTFLENILNNLNIKFSIRRVESKNSYSQIRITNKKDSLKLISFLYDSENEIGFERKKNKANLILNTFKDK